LTELRSLVLSYNHVRADGAKALASLTQLRSLALGGNEIGDEGAWALASLTELTSLRLEDNGLSPHGARALAKLHRLTVLELDGDAVGDEGARVLASLTNLVSLDLARNGIGNEGARALAALPKLASLDLTANRVTALSIFRPMAHLRHLNLASNAIVDAPQMLVEGECLTACTAYWRDLDRGATSNDVVAVLLTAESEEERARLAYCLTHGRTAPETFDARTYERWRFELVLSGGERVHVHLVDQHAATRQVPALFIDHRSKGPSRLMGPPELEAREGDPSVLMGIEVTSPYDAEELLTALAQIVEE